MLILREIIFLAMAIVFYFLLLERRFSIKKTLIVLITGCAIVFTLNAVFLITKDYALSDKIHILTSSVPSYLILIYLSKYRGFKILFNIFTTSFLCIIIELVGYFISAPFGFSVLASLIGRIIAFPLLLFLVLKFFRPLYMQMLHKLNKGWAIFCLIPLLSFILLYLLARYPVSIFDRPENILPVLITVAITFLVYTVISIFFRQIQQQFDMQSDQQILKLQVTALQNQSDAIMDAEEKTKILRHDMRHYMQNISVLLQRGDIKTAKEYIGRFDDLEEAQITKYCENPSINAVLVYHLEIAKKEGITITTRLDIPEKTRVDDMELSAVIANALENACNACRQMALGSSKSIKLTCISRPHFVFECANSYSGEVLFNTNGNPISNENGHGIGTKSIAAFAKKHNAIIDYQAYNGIFRLRILLM